MKLPGNFEQSVKNLFEEQASNSRACFRVVDLKRGGVELSCSISKTHDTAYDSGVVDS